MIHDCTLGMVAAQLFANTSPDRLGHVMGFHTLFTQGMSASDLILFKRAEKRLSSGSGHTNPSSTLGKRNR